MLDAAVLHFTILSLIGQPPSLGQQPREIMLSEVMKWSLMDKWSEHSRTPEDGLGKDGVAQSLPTTHPSITPYSVIPAIVYRAVMANSPTMARYRSSFKDC